MVWERMSEQDQQLAIEALPAHIKFWQAKDTSPEYIPHPRTWLYQERYHDEIEMPKEKVALPDWWRTEQGIADKARELGITARPGEGYFELKNRINEAIKRSA